MRKATENKTTKRGAKASKNVEAAKATETKQEEAIVEEVKAEEIKAEEPKTEEPQVAEEQVVEAKTTAKRETKTRAKKETKTETKKESKSAEKITLQVEGKDDLSMTTLIDRVKAAYVAEGHKATSIKNVEVYIKLSENMAYYVIDGYASGISLY